MLRQLLLISVLIFSFGCRRTPDERTPQNEAVDAIVMPQRNYDSDRLTNPIKGQWPAIQLFIQTFEAMYEVERRVDLVLAIDNSLKSIENIENQQRPDYIPAMGFLSRLDLLKTELLKLRASLEEGAFELDKVDAATKAYTALLKYIQIFESRASG